MASEATQARVRPRSPAATLARMATFALCPNACNLDRRSPSADVDPSQRFLRRKSGHRESSTAATPALVGGPASTVRAHDDPQGPACNPRTGSCAPSSEPRCQRSRTRYRPPARSSPVSRALAWVCRGRRGTASMRRRLPIARTRSSCRPLLPTRASRTDREGPHESVAAWPDHRAQSSRQTPASPLGRAAALRSGSSLIQGRSMLRRTDTPLPKQCGLLRSCWKPYARTVGDGTGRQSCPDPGNPRSMRQHAWPPVAAVAGSRPPLREDAAADPRLTRATGSSTLGLMRTKRLAVSEARDTLRQGQESRIVRP